MSEENGDRISRAAPSLAGPSRQGERRAGLRALGLAASRVAAPIIRARGGGALSRLKTEWPTIAGAEWANLAWPSALGRDGALKLRVAPAAALELQHRAPLLVERINSFFGRAVAARLVLVQGPLPLAEPARGAPPRLVARAEAAALDLRLAAIPDRELREALARLGRRVLAAPS
jgi:hypothetical protein